jgi:hypothetical protein
LGREKESTPETDMERPALNHVDRDAGVSMTQLEEGLNASHEIIWKVLQEQLLYPYNLQVQSLFIWRVVHEQLLYSYHLV